jgi:raffinose/stachyose/melibiose transport system permease protein
MRSISRTSPLAAVPIDLRPRRRIGIGPLATLALFLLPAAVVYTLFVLLPIVQAVYYSFFKWNGLGGVPTNFVGLANFSQVLQDATFRGAFAHNMVILVLSIATQLPLAFLLALLVRSGLKGRVVFRTIFFLPYVLSDVVTGVMWNFIYKPSGGLLNGILAGIIPGFRPIGFLGDPNMVLFALFLVMTWKYFGLHLLLFLAALQNVPKEVEEAAAIDGASYWQTILWVVLPLMGDTARLSIYLSALGSIQIFDLVWVMTTGGPVSASDTMATYMYKFGFQRFSIGYGSAVALIIFVACLILSLIYQRLSQQQAIA